MGEGGGALRARDAVVAAMVTVARALLDGRECVRVDKDRGDIVFPLPAGVSVRLEYNVGIELPELFSLITGYDVSKVREVVGDLVTVRRDEGGAGALRVYLDDAPLPLDQQYLSGLVGIIALWQLLKQHGIDFLADLERELRERREGKLQACAKLDRLKALLGVVLA